MARFCGNCGAELNENAKVCGQCGTPVGGNEKITYVKMKNPETQKKNKKFLKGIITLVLVAVVIVGGINMVSRYIGYNGLLRKTMSAYEKYDIDTLISLSSDIYYYFEVEDYAEDYFERAVGETLDEFESSVGHNYEFSYKIDEVYEASERQEKEFIEMIEATYPDFGVSLIKKIVVADITITAKQGHKSVQKDVSIVMSKEDKSWKLLYI